MKKTQAVLGTLLMGGLIGLLPRAASASGLELRIGGLAPRAKSILFDDSVSLYNVEKKDFYGAFGGVEFTKGLAPSIELGLSVDGYAREIPTFYRAFARPSGRDIEQTLRLVIAPASARQPDHGSGSRHFLRLDRDDLCRDIAKHRAGSGRQLLGAIVTLLAIVAFDRLRADVARTRFSRWID